MIFRLTGKNPAVSVCLASNVSGLDKHWLYAVQQLRNDVIVAIVVLRGVWCNITLTVSSFKHVNLEIIIRFCSSKNNSLIVYFSLFNYHNSFTILFLSRISQMWTNVMSPRFVAHNVTSATNWPNSLHSIRAPHCRQEEEPSGGTHYISNKPSLRQTPRVSCVFSLSTANTRNCIYV